MPNWSGGILTAKGRALQAKVEAGETLTITKMKLGSGTPDPEEIDNLTDLKQPINVMGISSKTVEDNICCVTSVILTSNIETAFYAREWGLFAQDPDEGEILYMYTTDPNPDFIPAKNAALVLSASYALNIAVLNVDNIVVQIDPEGLITTTMLSNELSKYVPLAGGIMTGLLSLFTGSTVPTPRADDNSQKIVNSEWVQTWVKALVAELAENIEVQWSGSTFTVPALGITGLMAQNGYICLGKLFGGLILQWGTYTIQPNNLTVSGALPIAFTRFYCINGTHIALGGQDSLGIEKTSLSTITVEKTVLSASGTFTIAIIAIGF